VTACRAVRRRADQFAAGTRAELLAHGGRDLVAISISTSNQAAA
jgi:hypothetical protein